jgi:hypothetical protein
MGLLDDAIREHLDLKRRRGADASEIAKEEADALGPVRRDAADQEPIDAEPAEHGSYADHEPAGLDEPAVAYDDEPREYDDAPLAYDDDPVVSEPPTTHDRPYAEPEEESATPPHGDPLAHQPTREFSATELDEALGHEEDEAPPAPEPSEDAVVAAGDNEEDVLEETPDFLQETPEHDRLWFEQKPPKDFDF